MWIESEHMLTAPEPSPAQRAKYARNYRGFGMAWLIVGIVLFGLGVRALLLHRDELWFEYFQIACGAVWLVMSWFYFKRARRWSAIV